MSDEYHSPEGRYRRRRLDRTLKEREVRAAGWFSRKRELAALRTLEASDGLEEATQSYARVLLCGEVIDGWQRISPHANQWHPRLLDHLPELAEKAAAAAILEAGDDALLRGMLTPSAAEQCARENVEAVQLVVDDPTIYVQQATASDGGPRTVLQHAASGLRGRFTVDRFDGFGVIFSKPYDIPSINPNDPYDAGEHWERYAGLGIGRRLYLAAAELHPHIRWGAGQQSPYAAPLRSRLHNADPTRWDGYCAWCRERLITWRSAGTSKFAQHPITPAPAAIQPRLIEITSDYEQ